MQNVALWTLGLLAQLWGPRHRAHQAVIGCLLSFSSSSAEASRPNQTGLEPRLFWRLNHHRAVWLNSKRSSACVSAAALCACVCVHVCARAFSQIWQENCHRFFYSLCLWESCYSVSGCCANGECVFVDAVLWQIHQLNNSSSSGCCFFFPSFLLYLLFAAGSRSVSGVGHWWMLSLLDLADTVCSAMRWRISFVLPRSFSFSSLLLRRRFAIFVHFQEQSKRTLPKKKDVMD